MKRVVTILAITLIVCASVFAADVSVGAFYGKGEAYAGAYVSAAVEPWKFESANVGFKADLLLGAAKKADGVTNDGDLHAVGSVKLVAKWDIKKLSILAGAGFTFNGFIEENGTLEEGYGPVGGVDTEIALSFRANRHFAVGLSFDAAFAANYFSITRPGELFPVEGAEFVPAGRFFFSYIF